MTKEQKILKELQKFKVSSYSYLVILREVSNGHLHTPTDLARATFTKSANITGLVDKLEKLGLVTRVVGNDRRECPVVITHKGIELWHRISNYEDDQTQSLAERLKTVSA